MEPLYWAALAIILLASLALLQILTTTRNPKSPPGPKPWPIIGNLNLIGSSPHQSLDKLSKKYGDIMLLKFGSAPVVVASSPVMAKEFLRTHDQTFSSRPITAAGKFTSYDCHNVAWAPFGPYWRQARKIYIHEILGPKQMDAYEYIRVEERQAFMSCLFSLAGQKVELREHLTHFALSHISRMVLGENFFSKTRSESKRSGSSEVKVDDLRNLLVEWFHLNGVFNLGDWIPWLGVFDLQGYVKRMKALHAKLDKFHSHVIEEHVDRKNREKENFVAKDMVDVMLQLAEDPKLEVKLTTDYIKGIMQDPIAGGTDGTVVPLEWAISELVKNPEVMKKAVEEVDSVVGKERWAQEKDIPQLPYISAVVNEALRLHPVATLLVPHFSTEDCEVSGYHIPKGTTVFVNVWSIGRDPKVWPEAEKFWPERFFENNIDAKGQHYELLPFGSGRRMCPGYSLGLKLVTTTLANLLQGFEWNLAGDMKPEDLGMEERYGLSTNRENPLEVVVKPRFPVHLY